MKEQSTFLSSSFKNLARSRSEKNPPAPLRDRSLFPHTDTGAAVLIGYPFKIAAALYKDFIFLKAVESYMNG